MVWLRTSIVAIALMALSTAGTAQNAVVANRSETGYVRAGAGFACRLTAEDFARTQIHRDFPGDYPCMRIGPLEMEMPRSDAEMILGNAGSTVMGNGRENFIYDVPGDRSGSAYVALTFKNDGHVDTLQLTGDVVPQVWSFFGITTGDSQEALTSRFGQPLQIDNNTHPGFTIWGYEPWTFSFELKDGRVWSIAIWEQ